MSQTAAIPSATETTTVDYDWAMGLPQRVTTGDGQTTYLCYYPVNATRESAPQVKSLIASLKLEDSAATSLSNAMALTCPVVPDAELPPLMAQYQYLKFPDGSVSEATLTLYGYAQTTKNQQGLLTPDTVLTLEGVSVEPTTVPWTVTQAEDRTGLSVSLQQIARTESAGVLTTLTTTTVWYKDNDARQTRLLKETLTANPAAGTLHAKTETTLKLENNTLTPVLSQHIRSARSGRLLRETQQDELGRPKSMVYHTYDASDRPLSSTESAFDSERFAKGAATEPVQSVETRVWIDDQTGSWVRMTGPDGRCGRVRYDGLQRPVRWELQRTAGTDHTDRNYVYLQEVTYGAEGEITQQCVYDYLPGGLCLRNEGAVLPDNLRDWFWQAEKNDTTTDAGQGETLTTETLTGTVLKGPLNALEMNQRNHRDGQVTLKQVHKRWHPDRQETSDTGLSTEEVVNAKGQRTRVTETLPGNDAILTRQWDTTYDELGRRTQIAAPDGSVTQWTYQGLSSTPTQIRVVSRYGEEKVLGQRTLRGAGNRGDNITALRVGNAGSPLQYTFDDTGYVQPDSSRLYSVRSDDGNTIAWYAKKTPSDMTSPGTLLGVFSFNAVTRAIHTHRPATADNLQDTITSTSLSPQLVGTYSTDRVIRNVTQTQRSRHSLRGELADVQHANGMATRAWADTQNRRTRVRRGQLEYRYRYGAQGECEHVTVQDMRTGRKQTVAYVYDEFGRESERTYRLDEKVRSRYVQTWSVIGQLLSKAWFRDGEGTATRTETFEYFTAGNSGRDELKTWTVNAIDGHEIRDASEKALFNQAYTYDVLGNMLTCTTTFTDYSIEVRTYGYDDVTQPTQRTSVNVSNAYGSVTTALAYDRNGNLTTNQHKQTQTYTATGQLQSVSTAANAAIAATYEYDEQGRLAAQWDEANKQRRILQYSDNQLCGEVWLNAQGQTIRRRVLDEEAGLVVQLHERQNANVISETLFIMPDPQHGGGEEFSLNSQGEWQSRSVGFTPWGEASLSRLNAMKSGLGYNGQRVDPVTGNYHPGHGYRVYDPQHQAFYQGDSLSPFGAGGLNDRAYCAGRDPVNWHDPSGHIMMSRREEATSLASLDDMIRDTAPPYHEPAQWWEWALLAAFFVLTVIGSIATGGLLGVILFTVGVSAFATGAASLALRQSNPALSEKLGWASAGLSLVDASGKGIAKLGGLIANGVRRGIQGLRNLRNVVKFHGVSALFKSSRGTRYIDDFSNTTIMTRGISKIPVPVPKPIRDLINSRRPPTPPASPGIAGRVPRRPVVTTTDLGKFELTRRSGDPSEVLLITSHGMNAIFGGKARIPNNSVLNLYAPATGVLASNSTYDTLRNFSKTKELEIVAAGRAIPVKTVPGNQYTANYKLSHFEEDSKGFIEYLVGQNKVDIISIKKGTTNDTSLYAVLSKLEQAGYDYKKIEGVFCRASEIKELFTPLIRLPKYTIV
ncbi:RHS repeat domain-containing protein [Pseudomonas poae]|uniref:Putative adhesin Stv domain-containing protein n=1 Tax=Pseudomonas poae TaxID=200451 RepID=A0A2S9EVR1_9PSED|nr:RHS repeat-associated core domain-containing protein [Pseudomonas poae]PRA28709.1 hypothetical protein CQZ97_13830 [Pseudomonas poae]PRC20406.1 hypothetical protein CQZ99_07075 [Pseudomonas poae]